MLFALTAQDVMIVKVSKLSNVDGVSFMLRDGNELFVARDTLKAVSLMNQPTDGGISLYAGDNPKTEILRISPNGAVWVHGRLAGTDPEIFSALQEFAKSMMKKNADSLN